MVDPPATGSGAVGGELQFAMNAPEPLVVHVDRADAAHSRAMDRDRLPLRARLGWNAAGLHHYAGSVPKRATSISATHGLTLDLDCIEAVHARLESLPREFA